MLHNNASYLELVQLDGEALQNIPESERTPEICLAAVKQNGEALKYVPIALQNDDLYLAAVRQNGDALRLIPKEKRTKPICLEAVKQSGQVLQIVPLDKRTGKICLAAVKQDGLALNFVPQNKRNADLYLSAVTQNGSALFYIPESEQSDSLYLAAVKQDGFALRLIPKHRLTEKLCLAAVQQNGFALTQVPLHLQTDAICLAAVQKNGKALQFVATDNQTDNVYIAAVKQDGEAIRLIPRDKQTDDLYLAAVTQNGRSIQYIPETKRTEALCLAAVEQNAEALRFIKKQQNECICLKAVECHPDALQYVEKQYIRKIVNQLGLNYFLSHYNTIKDLPNDCKQEIDSFLSQKSRLIVTARVLNQIEVEDAKKVYLHNKKNSIAVDSDKIDSLIDRLLSVNNKEALHLYLIGHSNVDADNLAGLSITEITQLCKKYPNIAQIHLVGCKTAQADTLVAEKQMIDVFNGIERTKGTLKYGLQTIVKAPQADSAFQQKCLAYCKKNGLAGVYVLNKEKDAYELIVMKTKANYIPKVKCIPEANHNAIDKIKGKQLPFPKKEQQINTIFGPQNPLGRNELAAVRALSQNKERFDSPHPKYAQDKRNYPFLATIDAKPDELNTSLMKKLVGDVQKNRITQDLTIKGIPKIASVDAHRKCIFVSDTHLYKNDYNSTFFQASTSNINYQELTKERQNNIKEMKKISCGKSRKTLAKQIQVTLPGIKN